MHYAFGDTIAGVKLSQLGNNYDYGILKFLRALHDVPPQLARSRHLLHHEWALLTIKKKADAGKICTTRGII